MKLTGALGAKLGNLLIGESSSCAFFYGSSPKRSSSSSSSGTISC